MDLVTTLRWAVERNPDRPAVRGTGRWLSYREWVLLLAGARLVWCFPVTVVGLAVLLMTGGTGAAVVALIVGSLVIQALFAALSMVARRIGPSAPTASLFGVIVCGVCSILAGLILGAAAGDLLP